LPFRRSNCAIALRDAGPLPLAVIESFYAQRSQPARVQVRDDALDAQLSGYDIEAPTDVLTTDAAAVARRCPSPIETAVNPSLDDAFARTYGALHDDERVLAYGRLLATIGPPGCAVTASIDGELVGMGFGVFERDWCGVFGMTTLPHARRRGVASSVLGALARAGAAHMYLQVESDNLPAHALYERAGFTRAYGYHYRTRALGGDAPSTTT
jgi:ribosomal protein S18 acetylase RimI-like enzyme